MLPPFSSTYFRNLFRFDIQAGLTVGVMAIPQAMAYGLLAGVPAIFGLYACLIPALVYAVFGQSRHLVVGPTAMEAILTAVAISQLVLDPAHLIPTLAVLTLSIGLIQMLIGSLKMGFLVHLISSPVLSGFTAGVAIIIIMNQVKHLLGVPIESGKTIIQWFPSFIQEVSSVNYPTLIFSIVSMFILWFGKKKIPSFPMALVVVVVGILVSKYFELDNYGVKVLGALDTGFPALTLPSIDFISDWGTLFQFAAAIALISIVTTTANVRVLQSKLKSKPPDINKDIRALGFANMGGAFFNAFPVSASFSRTFVNFENGAKTQVSGLVQVVVTLATILFLTQFFYYLPACVLGSIIIIATYSLVDHTKLKYFARAHQYEVWMFVITFFATILLGINFGILIGIGLSMILVIYKSSKPHTAILAQIEGTEYFKNITRYSKAQIEPEFLIIRFDHPLYYLNAPYFRSFIIDAFKKYSDVKHLIIHGGAISSIDSTGVETIEQILIEANQREISVYFTNCVGPVRDVFATTGLFEKLGADHFFMEVRDACNYIRNQAEPDVFDNQTNRLPK